MSGGSMSSRIWNLRLNLDTLNSLYMSAFTEAQKAEAFMGLMVGLNGGEITEQCSSIVRSGFELGSSMRDGARAYIAAKAEAGKKSATVRKEAYGSNQPQKPSESRPETAEQCSSGDRTDPRTTPEPIQQDGNPLKEVTVLAGKKSSAPKKPRPSGGTNAYIEPPPIPAELVPVAEWLVKDWPTVSYGKSGDSRKVQRYAVAGLWGRIGQVAQKCGVEPGPLLFSGVCYLDAVLADARDTGKPMYVKDMSNFWGIKEDTRKWDETYEEAKDRYKAYMEKQC